jgi:hypothetical protein
MHTPALFSLTSPCCIFAARVHRVPQGGTDQDVRAHLQAHVNCAQHVALACTDKGAAQLLCVCVCMYDMCVCVCVRWHVPTKVRLSFCVRVHV